MDLFYVVQICYLLKKILYLTLFKSHVYVQYGFSKITLVPEEATRLVEGFVFNPSTFLPRSLRCLGADSIDSTDIFEPLTWKNPDLRNLELRRKFPHFSRSRSQFGMPMEGLKDLLLLAGPSALSLLLNFATQIISVISVGYV